MYYAYSVPICVYKTHTYVKTGQLYTYYVYKYSAQDDNPWASSYKNMPSWPERADATGKFSIKVTTTIVGEGSSGVNLMNLYLFLFYHPYYIT